MLTYPIAFKNKLVIYLILNKVNGKVYIGQTSNIEKRWYYHLSIRYNKKYIYHPLYKAIRKYGIENFEFQVLIEAVNREQLNEFEIATIGIFDSTNSEVGYNLTLGGLGSNGFPCSEERKRKIAESKLGKPMKDHVKEALRKANTGRKLSKEQVEKSRIKLTGKKRSEETCRKIGLINKGRKWGDDFKEKVRQGVLNSNYKASEETKKKIGAALLGGKRSEETKKILSEKAKQREQRKRELKAKISKALKNV